MKETLPLMLVGWTIGIITAMLMKTEWWAIPLVWGVCLTLEAAFDWLMKHKPIGAT